MQAPFKTFDNDITFSVSENTLDAETIRLFGEKLLHVELNTAYGRKEIVCGSEPILNHVMLKNGEIERFSVFASYSIANDGSIDVLLQKSEDEKCVWKFDISNGVSEIDLFGNSFKATLSQLNSVE